MSNVDADGEVVVSLLSSKSIVDGVPLTEVKIKHTAGDADVHCFDVALPQHITESNVVVRIQVCACRGLSFNR
jgi:hypothetical protein